VTVPSGSRTHRTTGAVRLAARCHRRPASDRSRIVDDAHDFYGRNYWFDHQTQDLGFPPITARARADLPERCLHWLRALLTHTLPPGRILELGAAHGGFVALLRQAGFDAVGLELSPAIVELARCTFAVPMLCGRVEEQTIVPGSLDVIALFDVLEHLPDPVGTMRHCVSLLKPDGFLLVQTPLVPSGATHEDLVTRQDPFLGMLKSAEHLYLFTDDGVREFFRRIGVPELAFAPAIFAHYDMFFAASESPLVTHTDAEVTAALQSPGQRLALALLDLQTRLLELRVQHDGLVGHLEEVNRDRDARLAAIHVLDARLRALEAERMARHPRDWRGAPRQILVRWLSALVRR